MKSLLQKNLFCHNIFDLSIVAFFKSPGDDGRAPLTHNSLGTRILIEFPGRDTDFQPGTIYSLAGMESGGCGVLKKWIVSSIPHSILRKLCLKLVHSTLDTIAE